MSIVGRRIRYLSAAAVITLAVPLATATAANAAPGPPTITVPTAKAWNGLIAPGNAYSAGAMITVPHLVCPHQVRGSLPTVSEWVGLGGVSVGQGLSSFFGPPLIQAGIINQCGANGIQSNCLFWQDLPGLLVGVLPLFSAHILCNYTAQPGDIVSTSIDYTGGNDFSLAVSDLSSNHGWIWSMSLTDLTELGAVPTTAEWIVETPQNGPINSFRTQLPNFGTIQFQGVSYAPISGQGGQYVTDSEVRKIITDYPSGSPETKVSNLSGPGSNFTVQYQSP